MFLQTLTLIFLFTPIAGDDLKLSANSLPPLLTLNPSKTGLKLSGPIGQFIVQLARDLNRKILLTNEADSDICINNLGKGVNQSSLHILYERNFCFIYGNSRKYPAYVQMLGIFTFESMLMSVIPMYVTYFFYIYLLKTRYGVVNQVYSRPVMYTIAFHMHVPSTVYVPVKLWERIVMCNFALLVFWMNCYLQSSMARELTVPKFSTTNHPVDDVRTIEELEEFDYGIGLGKLCLQDLVKGLYKQRVCMLDCFDADFAIKNNEAIYSLGQSIDFQNIIKISKNCLFKDQIQRITKQYIEAGLFEKWFNEMHSLSYKYLVSTSKDFWIVQFEDNQSTHVTHFIGCVGGAICFIGEIVWFYRKDVKHFVNKRIRSLIE